MISAPAIGFEYRPSVWPGRFQAMIAVLACAAVLVSGVPAWAKGVLVCSLVLAVAYSRIKPGRGPVGVGWSAEAGWNVRTSAGDDVPAELRSWRAMGPALVLCLVAGTAQHTLWLLADNSDPDTRRRLRMRLATMADPADSRRS